MKFNLKLFVLVGVLAGFRDVCGMEKEEEKDDGDFIVDGLKDKEEERELNEAIAGKRVIKAVYKKDEGGNVAIIHGNFKNNLSYILVWNGKEVKKVEAVAFSGNLSEIRYDMQPNKKYTVYFIFKEGDIESAEGMFSFCSSLTKLDLSNFNTENVKNMTGMFYECPALTTLNLSNFNTESVTNMSCMFCHCSSLTKLDLRNFNTENVTNMSNMFSCCTSLTKLDLSNFNTSNVIDMYSMFNDCSALKELNLSSFNTQNVTDMSRMFCNCSALTKLDLSNFKTQNVTDMYGMFAGCTALTKLNLCSFDTKKVTDMSGMFYNCTALQRVFLPSEGTEIKKRCICCVYGPVYWNNREVRGLNPKMVQFKDPKEIIEKISTVK